MPAKPVDALGVPRPGQPRWRASLLGWRADDCRRLAGIGAL